MMNRRMYDTHSRRRVKEKERAACKRERDSQPLSSPFRSDRKQNRVGFCSKGSKNSWHDQLFELDSGLGLLTHSILNRVIILSMNFCTENTLRRKKRQKISKPKIERRHLNRPLIHLFNFSYFSRPIKLTRYY